MQGSCSTLPTDAVQANITGVPLRSFNPDQCLIVTDADVFPVRSGRLWMHNVYIRVSSAPLTPARTLNRCLFEALKGSVP